MDKLRGRPRIEDQAAQAAKSMEMLEAYLTEDVTHAELCDRYGITSRAIRLRLASARKIRFGGVN